MKYKIVQRQKLYHSIAGIGICQWNTQNCTISVELMFELVIIRIQMLMHTVLECDRVIAVDYVNSQSHVELSKIPSRFNYNQQIHCPCNLPNLQPYPSQPVPSTPRINAVEVIPRSTYTAAVPRNYRGPCPVSK